MAGEFILFEDICLRMNLIKRKKLIAALLQKPKELEAQLAKLKSEAIKIKKREDWLWHLLLVSMATMGNSRG